MKKETCRKLKLNRKTIATMSLRVILPTHSNNEKDDSKSNENYCFTKDGFTGC
jgi:hypothetical protein